MHASNHDDNASDDADDCSDDDHDDFGRGGSLVDSAPFVRRVAGSNPALAAT